MLHLAQWSSESAAIGGIAVTAVGALAVVCKRLSRNGQSRDQSRYCLKPVDCAREFGQIRQWQADAARRLDELHAEIRELFNVMRSKK